MKVGDEFSSYEEFIGILTMCKKVLTMHFGSEMAEQSKTNENEPLKAWVRFMILVNISCSTSMRVKGGRIVKSKNKDSKRKYTTL